MKILLVAADTIFTDEIRAAFAAQGHSVFWINNRRLRAWPFLWRLIRSVELLRRFRNEIIGRYIVRRAKTVKPNLVLICKGMTVQPSVLQKIRSMRIPLANWFPENANNEPYRSWIRSIVGEYDYFFSFDSSLLAMQYQFPHTRIVYLPLGVDPAMFDPNPITAEERNRFETDICFVGAWYPERERLLASLDSSRIKIFGWRNWEHSALAHRYFGPLNAVESAKAYSCAKIVINTNLEPPIHGVNAKTFEICAAGGFQLTDFRADLPHLFLENEELVVFRSPQELRSKIEHYLGDAVARTRIADAGRQRVNRDHTMRQRVSEIVRLTGAPSNV